MLFVKSKVKEMIDEDKNIENIVSETMERCSNIIGKTLGPGGRICLLDRGDAPPLATKDGVTVLKHLGFSAATENIILDTIKEISLNTAKDAGDGTSSAIIIANSIYKYGKDFVNQNPKYNPQRFMRDIKNCYDKAIIPCLRQIASPTKTDQDLFNVALISSNGDEEIARCVTKAVISSGDDGTVLVQESQGNEMVVETVDGYIVTAGLKDISIGSAFINDRAGQQVRMEEGLVVLFDDYLNDMVLLSRVQDAFENHQECFGKPILIFAHGFSDAVIEKCLKTSRSGVTVLPVKIPKSGLPNSCQIFLHDMAAYTDGTVMDPASAVNFEAKDFGTFSKARINMYETFVQSISCAERIDSRVEELKAIMNAAYSEHDKAHLRAHIGKLTGGISTILVGGITDAEIRERKDRVQDAIEAVRSAIAEGVVVGGGVTHKKIIEAIRKHNDYKTSWEVMCKALEDPFKKLMTNCGEEDLIEQTWEKLSDDNVFNADTHEIVDAWDVGLIEPSKVHRIAIGNAISISSLLVTLGGIVCSPRDANLETQMELSTAAFKDAIANAGDVQ